MLRREIRSFTVSMLTSLVLASASINAVASPFQCQELFTQLSTPQAAAGLKQSALQGAQKLVQARQFQDAVWLLRQGGAADEADALESKLIHALQTATVVKIESLPDATTNPKKVTLNDPELGIITAVYKSDRAKPWAPPYGAVREAFQYASHRYEIASSVLDRILGFDVVPLTVRRALSDRDQDGSLQLFMENSLGHWDLFSKADKYSMDRPVSMQKYYELFDILQMNPDRGFLAKENYRVLSEDHKRVALIDNGLAFQVILVKNKISAYNLIGALPDKPWFVDHLRVLTSIENVDQIFGDLLSADQKAALRTNAESIMRALEENNFDPKFFTHI